MKLLKFKDFLLKENISINIEDLLQSVNAKILDIYYLLELNKDIYLNKNIEDLYNDSEFNKNIFYKKLKKSELISTLDIENFIKNDHELKYFLLIDKEDSKLDTPKYIIIQYKTSKWSKIFMYEFNNNIRIFIEKLTSRTIEIIYKNNSYIYQTSNSGNDWILQNLEDKNKIFKYSLNNDELKNIIKEKDPELNIIN